MSDKETSYGRISGYKEEVVNVTLTEDGNINWETEPNVKTTNIVSGIMYDENNQQYSFESLNIMLGNWDGKMDTGDNYGREEIRTKATRKSTTYDNDQNTGTGLVTGYIEETVNQTASPDLTTTTTYKNQKYDALGRLDTYELETLQVGTTQQPIKKIQFVNNTQPVPNLPVIKLKVINSKDNLDSGITDLGTLQLTQEEIIQIMSGKDVKKIITDGNVSKEIIVRISADNTGIEFKDVPELFALPASVFDNLKAEWSYVAEDTSYGLLNQWLSDNGLDQPWSI
jgi:hypothetical protein